MITLIPEEVNFQISTTDILVTYTERNYTAIKLDVLELKDSISRENYTPVEIRFDTVAELKCTSLNFYEAMYDQFEIFNLNDGGDNWKFLEENGYHPDSGLYQVDSSELLEKSKLKYDPKNSLRLKHFLIVGNDSYVELLAKGYSVEYF